MWAFYRNESESAPRSFPALHGTSASLRHQLRRKLGGMGGAPEDLSYTAAGGGGGNKSSSRSGGGGGPGATTSTTTTLMDDLDLQYSWPVVSTGRVLCTTPQEHFVVGGSSGSGGGGGGGSSSSGGTSTSSGATRTRGRRSASSAMAGTTSSSQQGEDGNRGSGWGPSSLIPPGLSLQQGSGGDGDDVDGGMGFIGNSSGDENLTIEDPNVRASLKGAVRHRPPASV
ncbi:unnamed protein product, partial [Ectocarpus sp. 4 AP-2014]